MATLILLFSRDYLRVAAVMIFIAACPFAVRGRAQGTTPPLSKNLAERSAAGSGRKTFETVCAACHGLDGRGGERGQTSPLAPRFRSLLTRKRGISCDPEYPRRECPRLARWEHRKSKRSWITCEFCREETRLVPFRATHRGQVAFRRQGGLREVSHDRRGRRLSWS